MLEEKLAVKLFLRTPQGALLTAKGEAYYQTVRHALDILSNGTRQIQKTPGKQVLRLRVPPTFGLRWLVPRLAGFHSNNRGVEVQIITSHQPADFSRDEVDAFIQSDACGPTAVVNSPAVHMQKLFGEVLLPVCSPELLRSVSLHTPADLKSRTLLSSLHRPNDWRRWFETAGIDDFDPDAGIKFENSALSYQAAIDQLGVAIAQRAFIGEELRSGRLVEPFDIVSRTEWSYFLVYPRDRTVSPALELFEQWLLQESGNLRKPAGLAA
jgi:LysR family glycine cleavage system transcriptional activator